MIVLSSSGVAENLFGMVEPWKLAQHRGPPVIRARVGTEEVVLALERKDLLKRGKSENGTRIKGFNRVFRHSVFSRYCKVTKQRNKNGKMLCLVHCKEEDDQQILLGFYCGSPGETYHLIPEDAVLLLEKHFQVESHPILVFAAKMLSNDAVIVMGRERGNGSFVDIFTCEGCQRVPRKYLETRTKEHHNVALK